MNSFRHGRDMGSVTILLLILVIISGGCQGTAGAVLEQNSTVPPTAESVSESAVQAIPTYTRTAIPPTAEPLQPTLPPPPTVTSIPTVTSSPTNAPTDTPSPTATWTPPPIGLCENRIPPDDDLLTLVTHLYGLSRDYQPGDIVPLSDYFPVNITLGYQTEVRQVVIAPLQAMIRDMEAAGLRPFIISGYRSYSAQSIAWAKWVEYNPDYAAGLSARPGHSEHQLGTTIDFGSPELEAVTGIEDIEFHTYFYMTSEGAWLIQHAHEYGFTMSFPPDTLEITGFYYEPWHYRYVGVELATLLKQQDIYLIKYLLENFPLPCNEE
jgi:D-alanyl-D-alanine carboxypeptidase